MATATHKNCIISRYAFATRIVLCLLRYVVYNNICLLIFGMTLNIGNSGVSESEILSM